MGQRILQHFGIDPSAIVSVRQKNDPAMAGRPANLSFNLHPILSKLKTRPQNCDEQLNTLTHAEPLRT